MGKYLDNNTLLKVRMTLIETGCSDWFAEACIVNLHNAGILFSTGDSEIVTTREEITTDVEIPLISKDEMLRLEALTIANDGAIHHGVSAEHVLGRAEIFVDYIKNGVHTDG